MQLQLQLQQRGSMLHDTYLDVVGGIVEKAEHDRQNLLRVVQDLGLAVLGELPQAEARALAHVGARV